MTIKEFVLCQWLKKPDRYNLAKQHSTGGSSVNLQCFKITINYRQRTGLRRYTLFDYNGQFCSGYYNINKGLLFFTKKEKLTIIIIAISIIHQDIEFPKICFFQVIN